MLQEKLPNKFLHPEGEELGQNIYRRGLQKSLANRHVLINSCLVFGGGKHFAQLGKVGLVVLDEERCTIAENNLVESPIWFPHFLELNTWGGSTSCHAQERAGPRDGVMEPGIKAIAFEVIAFTIRSQAGMLRCGFREQYKIGPNTCRFSMKQFSNRSSYKK